MTTETEYEIQHSIYRLYNLSKMKLSKLKEKKNHREHGTVNPFLLKKKKKVKVNPIQQKQTRCYQGLLNIYVHPLKQKQDIVSYSSGFPFAFF
jgi:hypothetical protein